MDTKKIESSVEFNVVAKNSSEINLASLERFLQSLDSSAFLQGFDTLKVHFQHVNRSAEWTKERDCLLEPE